jgi:hypothetical protein
MNLDPLAFIAIHSHRGDHFDDVALSIADLRRQDGHWKLCHSYGTGAADRGWGPAWN